MKKELIAETMGYGCFELKVYRMKRDGGNRHAFRHHVTYQVEVNGEVKHPNLSSEDAIGALTNYINGITHQLSKAGQVVK